MNRRPRHRASIGDRSPVRLDARSRDRLVWIGNVIQHFTHSDASVSVLVRVALDHYCRSLEEMLKRPNEARLRNSLRRAAKGTEAALPEDLLRAVPPVPFRLIEDAARPR